jgi:hypothetical protein
MKPAATNRPVFLAQRVGEGEQEFVFGLVVFVKDEMVEPTGCQYRDERLLDRGSRAFDRRLERVELAVDGFGRAPTLALSTFV